MLKGTPKTYQRFFDRADSLTLYLEHETEKAYDRAVKPFHQSCLHSMRLLCAFCCWGCFLNLRLFFLFGLLRQHLSPKTSTVFHKQDLVLFVFRCLNIQALHPACLRWPSKWFFVYYLISFFTEMYFCQPSFICAAL